MSGIVSSLFYTIQEPIWIFCFYLHLPRILQLHPSMQYDTGGSSPQIQVVIVECFDDMRPVQLKYSVEQSMDFPGFPKQLFHNFYVWRSSQHVMQYLLFRKKRSTKAQKLLFKEYGFSSLVHCLPKNIVAVLLDGPRYEISQNEFVTAAKWIQATSWSFMNFWRTYSQFLRSKDSIFCGTKAK